MQFKTIAVTSAAALAFGASLSASAAVVNFDQSEAQSPEGSVSYDGNGGALVGSGISFGEISLNGATAPQGNQGTLTCSGCMIDFQTGNNLSEGTENNIWTFAGGGNLTLSGSAIDSNGNEVASGNLFSGSFDGGADAAPQLVTGNGQDSLTATLSGSDEFNADLARYFGLSEDTSFDFTNTVIALGNASFGADGSFDSGQLQNADVTVESSQAVPEPSEMGMFAAGLALVIGALGFRRRQNADAV
ncbi:PEP-CTERM sorting domain-containing protein [Salinisphaera sp. T31B1]|uniref:PEP-CTERM sorting domain-containing protein n=1 Tax=Salinisphaera sp. T31B1 TaxID=727963 RepID=UPI00333E8BBA